ncbi:phosphodiester glycosidase family protein [Ureibacillus aquaedulcis]|uniref:Phosphodiester glycosidase family protein n=1 Tax=Ureibacillus aquaedulcis TaxID=3058421 RepID=A0ABT8GQ58_9BACL|nr:phosphodiester glycosidase family protein [Ureibacillus sp. BA0131]MDN4493553.1 phosphodiester glycosidase family protein [Ureibacillus sp. BA0131]
MPKKALISLLFFFLFGIFVNSQANASSFGVIEGGTNRTLIPLRTVSDTFKVPVEWNNKKKVVMVNHQYTLTVGSKLIQENGQVVRQMDSQPKIINSTVYVPVREIGFLFNTPIKWNNEKQQVEFTVNSSLYTIPVFREAIVKKPKVQVAKKSVAVGGKNFSVNTVSVNLLAPNTTLHVEVANNKMGSVGTLASIAKNHNAKVAINANYFDAYTNNSVRTVYNALVMNGKKIQEFDPKFSTFYYTKDGDIGILPGAKVKELYNQGHVEEAIQVGPRLVTNGSITVNPISEGFTSHKILSSPGARSAVGILKNRQLIFVATSGATVEQLASIMKQLGATDAMNLDGGASSGLYANGKYLSTPGRNIAVALLVK